MVTTVRKATKRSSTDRPPESFWILARSLQGSTERERLARIHVGLDARWLSAAKQTFRLTIPSLATMANVSPSTMERWLKSKAALDPVVSERIDRLAQVAVLAEDVFEDKEAASTWMSTPNDSLGGVTPLSLCETELGARQVRRVLNAIEWGGAV